MYLAQASPLLVNTCEETRAHEVSEHGTTPGSSVWPLAGRGVGATHLLVRLLLLGHHSRLQGQPVAPAPPAHLGRDTTATVTHRGGTAGRARPASVHPSVYPQRVGNTAATPAPAQGASGRCRPRGDVPWAAAGPEQPFPGDGAFRCGARRPRERQNKS